MIILSESAARHFWPGTDPVGRRLFLGREGPLTVAGVVPDTRYRDLRTARPSVYFPLAQSFFPFAPTNLAIRTSGPPSQLIPLLRHTLEAADPALGLASAAPFSSFLEAPLAQPRLNAMLLAGFALTALLLSAVGLFGVMAALVGQRTRELGIRMALGAGAGGLQILVFRRALAIAAAGLVAGLAGALAANQLLRALLYEVSPSDGLTLLLVAAGLLVVAVLAAAVPARATTRIDPAIVLRSDG